MPRPYWLSATDAPWCCWNDQQIIPLDSTEICAACPMWKPREESDGAVDPLPKAGAMPFRTP